MATQETRTLAEMQAEMSNDISGAWSKVSHYSENTSFSDKRHLIVKGRTIIRDYRVKWEGNAPEITETRAEVSEVGEVFNASQATKDGWKRHKGFMMYNEITRELATL